MKPLPVPAVIYILLTTALHAQRNDTADRAKYDIHLQDGNFQIVDGRNSLQHQSRYSAENILQLPLKDGQNGRHIFIERKRNELKSEASLNPQKHFETFIGNLAPEADHKINFRITDIHQDRLGITHIRSVQQFNGIDIYGSESTYHIDSEKERYTGSMHKIIDLVPASPVISDQKAVEKAIDDLKSLTRYRELSEKEKELLRYDHPEAILNYYCLQGSEYRLAWVIAIRPNFIEEWKYFVDALDGSVLLRYNNTKADGPATGSGADLNNNIRTFNVYQTAGIFYLYDISQKMYNPSTSEGIIITLDGNGTSTLNLDYTYVTSADNTWNQSAAISAHCNAAKTYQYFDTTFNRNSLNGSGGNIISIVNITNDDGTPMENAFWNGQAVFYGNGGGQFKSVAGALDVTAHELSHAVIGSTANLDYYGQSGAINESFADIFACMIDRNDWTIGEDITLEGFSPSGAIRDLADPHNKGTSADHFWQPIHTTEMQLGPEDNGGIHLNSGIINHAFYIFASRVGKSKAEQVFYRALTEYLTKTSGFIELRIAVVQSARDLYGVGSIEMYEAAQAFESVGIYEEEYVDKTPEYSDNPGERFLLSYDTNPADPVSLYLSTAQGTNYRPLTRTPMTSKVSVSDDGSTGVFVSTDRRIRMINTGTGDINERIISGFNYYDRVAISRDGKRLAATKAIYDASIYVFDLVSGEARQFLLYNPTTDPGTVDAGGVKRAYSVEFDITGEYLIYDAYNVINSNSNKDIYYRDIAFIRIWNNETGSFGDGNIKKLYSALPANVNVANPVFARNSPYIIAFDYFYDDGIIERYSIQTANLLTGKTSLIASNDRMGYPSFSTPDDRIAFSTTNSSNMQVIKSVRLAADKMTPAGDPGVLVPDAKWPVYFARGIRSLGLAPVSDFTADFKYGNYPVTTRFFDRSVNKPLSWHWKFEGGTPAESDEQNPVTVFETPGFYNVTLITVNEYGSDTLVRESYIHAINPTDVDNYSAMRPVLYPNPVSDEMYIVADGEFSVNIYNLQGELIHTSENTYSISVSDMASGIYMAEIKNHRTLYRLKFVKQ